jgi:hypothetical protein
VAAPLAAAPISIEPARKTTRAPSGSESASGGFLDSIRIDGNVNAMRRPAWIDLATSALALGLVARPAAAVEPCFDVCHLGQGQPLLLADTDQLWVRRCSTAKPGAAEACALERVDATGRVLEKAPLAGRADERAFESAHLRGHRVVRFGHQTAWTDLTKPYAFTPFGVRGSMLRLDRDALVCAPARAKSPTVRRALGCTPRSVSLLAAGVGRDGKPEDPTGLVALVATCAEGRGTRQAVAICRPPR